MSVFTVQDNPIQNQPADNRTLRYSMYPDIALARESKQNRKESRQRSLDSLCDCPECPLGVDASEHFQKQLIRSERKLACLFSRLEARMVVNMTGGVIENAGLCLDRLFSMPYVPGTAIKGLTRAAALMLDAAEPDMDIIFGSQAGRGSVVFLNAYPTNRVGLELDILTVHHQKYYEGGTTLSDATDTEDPVPVQFPVVPSKTEFIFLLSSVDENTTEQQLSRAREWLKFGLENIGIGSKTSAGYGWFTIDEPASRQFLEAERQARQAEIERETRRKNLDPIQLKIEDLQKLGNEEFAAFVKTLADKGIEDQRACIRLLSGDYKKKWKTWTKLNKKKGMNPFVVSVLEIAKEIGEPLRGIDG